MINSKLILGLCAIFLMIWTTSAEIEQETTRQKYRNYDGPIIRDSDETHPSNLCVKAVNISGSYWENLGVNDICNEKIKCRIPRLDEFLNTRPGPDIVVLDVKPDTGVVCDGIGREVCMDRKCTNLMFEEVAAQAEREAKLKKIYANYDGEVIEPGHEKFPTSMCVKEFNELDAVWSNVGLENSCSTDIECYRSSLPGTVSLNKKPENGVIVDWPVGRTLCVNGQRRHVEYYLPEDKVVPRIHPRRAHRIREGFGKYRYVAE